MAKKGEYRTEPARQKKRRIRERDTVKKGALWQHVTDHLWESPTPSPRAVHPTVLAHIELFAPIRCPSLKSIHVRFTYNVPKRRTLYAPRHGCYVFLATLCDVVIA